MAKTPSFRKNDVTRAIEAVKAGGISISRIEVVGAKIVIVSASADNANDEYQSAELTAWERKHGG